MINPTISIVAPVFNEEEVIEDFCHEVIAVLETHKLDYEIILVDDGSTDRTHEIIKILNKKNPKIKTIKFSRNFGHQIAFAAGLDAARGKAAITMDSDLQHPPAIIPKLVEKWNAGHDVVYTIRQNPEGAGALKEIGIRLAYQIINALGGIKIEFGVADFRLIDRKVLNYLKRLEERRRFLRGLIVWMGFKQAAIPYQVAPRTKGQAKYNFFRLLNLALDGILSFSCYPLRLASIAGAIVSSLGFLYGCYALYAHLILQQAPTGWTSLLISLLLLGGIQLLFLGILGEYLGRVYEEVKRRPIYVAEATIGFDEN